MIITLLATANPFHTLPVPPVDYVLVTYTRETPTAYGLPTQSAEYHHEVDRILSAKQQQENFPRVETARKEWLRRNQQDYISAKAATIQAEPVIAT